MSYVANYKRKVKYKIRSLAKTLRQTYTDFLAKVSSETKTRWHNAKLVYDPWLEKGEARLFSFGNKAGRRLANFAKGLHPSTQIKTLRDKYNPLHHTPAKIN